MKKLNFKGWASFWNTIYVMPGYEHATWLIRHEIKHLEQIKRDGRIWFAIKYSYWFIKYGYHRNPYEVEAREAEKLK
jgi:hypothetical protein